MSSLCIVISSYNGSEYLPDQLDSLMKQLVGADRIHIRDDGSTDGTKEVIRYYSERFQNITYEFGENVGWKKSFPLALAACEGFDRYAFCDQDDVWLPNKIAVAQQILNQIDNSEEPCLYAGNVLAVNSSLEPIKLFNPQPVDIETRTLPKTITRDNMAGGLTYVFNAKARDMLLSFRDIGITGHDRILMLICKACGTVRYDHNSYVLYRQHDGNVYGVGSNDVLNKLSWYKRFTKYLTTCDNRDCLAQSLLSFDNMISRSDSNYLKLCSTYKSSLWNRLKLFLYHDIGGYNIRHCLKLRIKVLMGTY